MYPQLVLRVLVVAKNLHIEKQIRTYVKIGKWQTYTSHVIHSHPQYKLTEKGAQTQLCVQFQLEWLGHQQTTRAWKWEIAQWIAQWVSLCFLQSVNHPHFGTWRPNIRTIWVSKSKTSTTDKWSQIKNEHNQHLWYSCVITRPPPGNVLTARGSYSRAAPPFPSEHPVTPLTPIHGNVYTSGVPILTIL